MPVCEHGQLTPLPFACRSLLIDLLVTGCVDTCGYNPRCVAKAVCGTSAPQLSHCVRTRFGPLADPARSVLSVAVPSASVPATLAALRAARGAVEEVTPLQDWLLARVRADSGACGCVVACVCVC